MLLKAKNFRLEENIADDFAMFCQDQGVVQERTVEALLVYAMENLTAAGLGELLDAATKRKSGVTSGDLGVGDAIVKSRSKKRRKKGTG